MRPTYAEIDLGSVRANVAAFKDLISPSKVCVVVKADGYGHGDAPIAEAALEAGAEWLAVALLEEGIRLRESGIEAPILLLSEPGQGTGDEIADWELTPTVYSEDFASALAATKRPLQVHVKVDTGMHRVGVATTQLDRLMSTITKAKNLEVAAIWTHFAVADEDPGFTNQQIEAFETATAVYEIPMTHLANTAGAVLFPDSRRSMCRIGLGTYGLHPCPDTRALVDLRPVMRIVSHVSHVQQLPAGARPSYGRVRALPEAGAVATVPIGYADGFPRRLTPGAEVLVGGRRHRLAGTVTMDQIVVDVGGSPVSVGDEVVLLGSQGEAAVTADEWADLLGTISYEVVCEIGPRVPRRYVG